MLFADGIHRPTGLEEPAGGSHHGHVWLNLLELAKAVDLTSAFTNYPRFFSDPRVIRETSLLFNRVFMFGLFVAVGGKSASVQEVA